MYFNRAQAKLAARSSMKQTRPSYLMVMAIYVLLTTGVSYLLTTIMGGDIPGEFMHYIQQGYDPMEVMRYLLEQNSKHMALFGVVQFVQGIYNILVGLGLTSYTLRMARNENPGYNNLLDGFLKAGRVLLMDLLIVVFSVGWYLVVFMPLIGAALMMDHESFVMDVLAGLMVIGVFVVIAMVLRYILADYYLLDDPDCTAREAISRSKAAMKGHRWEYVVLEISFFGWALLIGLVSSLAASVWAPLGTIVTAVATLWYTPYVMVTRANFYDYVSSTLLGEWSSGNYAGPIYDYHASDGPEPF